MKNFILKKVAIAIIAATTAGVSTTAQVKFGVKAGVNLSSVSNVEASGPDTKAMFLEQDGMTVGYHAGVFANISLGSMLGFQPELLFSMQGGQQKPGKLFSEAAGEDLSGAILQYQLGYVTLPLLLEIKPAGDLGILVGPQVSYNLMRKATSTFQGEKETISGSEFDDSFAPLELKKLDAGVVVGLQYTFIGKVSVGVRYYYGLMKGFDKTQDGATFKGFSSSVVQGSLGYSF
jgi:hypothetical protein